MSTHRTLRRRLSHAVLGVCTRDLVGVRTTSTLEGGIPGRCQMAMNHAFHLTWRRDLRRRVPQLVDGCPPPTFYLRLDGTETVRGSGSAPSAALSVAASVGRISSRRRRSISARTVVAELGATCPRAGFRPDVAKSAMRRACKTAGIAHYHPHDLRRRYASVQIARGVPVTQLLSQLGHTRKSMTLDVYSHVLLDESAPVGGHRRGSGQPQKFGVC